MILSKETSLFQHDKIKDGIDNASKEASNYLTDIDSGGVYVHAFNNNSDGVRITDRIDIVRGDSSVAEYGTSVRIGSEALGSSTIYIDPGSADTGITNVFRIIASNGVDAFNILLDEDHISDGLTMTKHFDSAAYNYGSISDIKTDLPVAQTLTETKVISELQNVDPGKTFIITFKGELRTEWDYYYEPVTVTFDFTKGSDESKRSLQMQRTTWGAEVYLDFVVDYTANTNSITVTLSARKSTMWGNYKTDLSTLYLSEISYEMPGMMIPIHRLNGDAYLNCESVGFTYIGLNVDNNADASTDAIDGDDKDLFNAIRKLGWYSDVIDE